jgi:phosphate transport system protein
VLERVLEGVVNQADKPRVHISAQFNAELEGVRNDLMTMGGLVESQIDHAIEAALDGDSARAENAIELDLEVNELERSIDEQCTRILVLRQPAAGDLRLVLATIKVTNDLERIGDEAVKISRQAIELSEGGALESASARVRELAVSVNSLLKDSLDSFARLQVSEAATIILRDDDIDEAYTAAKTWLTSEIQAHPETLEASLAYLGILKSLERVADHAVNIAEQVIFLTRGVDVRHLDTLVVRDLVS